MINRNNVRAVGQARCKVLVKLTAARESEGGSHNQAPAPAPAPGDMQSAGAGQTHVTRGMMGT